MNILFINTCLKQSEVCVLRDNETFYATKYDNIQHSVTLLNQIEEAIFLAKIVPKDLDYIAVLTGTGSFTGIRIGLAVAKGLANALNIPIIPIDTLSYIAYNSCEKCQYVVMKGVADEFFVGDINSSKLADNQRLLKKVDLVALVDKTTKICTVDTQLDLSCEIMVCDTKIDNSLISMYIVKAQSPENVQPIYLRLSQAEMQKKTNND